MSYNYLLLMQIEKFNTRILLKFKKNGFHVCNEKKNELGISYNFMNFVFRYKLSLPKHLQQILTSTKLCFSKWFFTFIDRFA